MPPALAWVMQTMNPRALLVGGLLGILSTLTGLSAAKADSCETIELRDGVRVVQCDHEAFPEESDACVQVAETVDCDSTYSTGESCDEAMGAVYDACMVILVNTPDWTGGAL